VYAEEKAMNDVDSIAARRDGRPANRTWWRLPASWRLIAAFLLAALALSSTASVRRDAAVALAPALRGNPPPVLQQAQPVNYHIHGDATVIYDYSSDAGQKELATCHVDLVPQWHLVLDGTLDSVGQTLKGTFELTGLDLDKWQQWDSTTMQCGPDMHGLTSCSVGCGPNWVTYRYSTYTGFPGDTFTGTYDSKGNITILGSASFGARDLFLDCANGETGVTIACEKALGFTPNAIPPFVQAPNNAKYALLFSGVHDVVIVGQLTFTDDFSGVSIHANMNLPESDWAECCIISDPLFLSDKNHVSITGEAVPPPPR
jgi:hypothetical protein